MPVPLRRVFCLSLPRNATGSWLRFCADAGLATPAPARTATWSAAWLRGDMEAIFADPAFLAAQAFAGAPWSLPEFYKVLCQSFPRARFVLFTREPEAWWRSLLAAGGGLAAESNRLHAKRWRRELDFFRALHAGEIDDRDDARGRQLPLHAHAAHYLDAYRLHNSEVLDYFGRHAPEALHWGELEDPRKWARLADFLGVRVAADYRCHLNATPVARTGT
jgi:hypothetical protein